MLELNTNQKIHIIPLPVRTSHFCLIFHTSKIVSEGVYMTYITDKEEELLDAGKSLNIQRDDRRFNISKNNIYCYGEIDFSNDSEDMEQISSFSFLNSLGAVGIRIPSDYNYENHECHSPINRVRWYETWRPEVLAKYAHGCLGKPEKIVLFTKRW